MQIIQIEPYANGARPALQEWSGNHPPEGYAMIAEEFAEVFYSTRPAGFVTLTIEENEVIGCVVDWDAYHAYVNTHPAEPDEPSEPGETEDAMWDAMAEAIAEGVNAV